MVHHWRVRAMWILCRTTLLIVCDRDITTFRLGTVPLDCQPLGEFIDLMARIGMACASALLMFRTFALWNNDLRVVVPLVLLHLGQWALYLHASRPGYDRMRRVLIRTLL